MKKVIELVVSDWKRYLELHNKRISIPLFLGILFHNPGMFFSLVYRVGYALIHSKVIIFKVLGGLLYPFYYLITYFIFDIDIPLSVTFGKGLYIHNRGITFTNGVVCGDNNSIMGPVTVGMRGLRSKDKGAPMFGDNVTLYSGARVFGSIVIGSNVEIGANAVVGKSFPANTVLAGIPAKIIKRI